ncbi:MAG: type II toxin-antitoxin system Phd/YefM family antitoxin [Patescibacteria group bacterium]
MKTVSAYKARTNFGELLNEVYYRGEEITVEKMGKPVVKIIPLKKEERVSKNPFLAAAGSWKEVKAEKLIKEIYRRRKDDSRKRKFLVIS